MSGLVRLCHFRSCYVRLLLVISAYVWLFPVISV